MRLPARAAWVGLASLGIGALRFATRPPTPDDYDAIGFVRAVDQFDLARLQPHPPGYPVYVALAKVVHEMGASPLVATTAVSSLAAAVTAASLWVAVAAMAGFSRERKVQEPAVWAAWIALLLYGGAAQPWTLGAAALSDGTAGAFAMLAVALLMVGRPLWGGLAMGLMLGTRASYLPIALSWMVLVLRRATVARAMGGLCAGVALWLVPFVFVVGAGPLARLAGEHARGHFSDWGGSIATRPDLVQRIMALLRDLFFDGLAPATWALCVIAGAGLISLVRSAEIVAADRVARRPALGLALIAVTPYGLWVFFGQNVIDQPRHLLPLVLVVIVLLAQVLARVPIAASVAVAAVWAAGLPVALAHHRSEAPAAQLVAWISDHQTDARSPSPDAALADTVLFGGRSIRFARLLAPGLAVRERTWLSEVDVDLERMNRLPPRILVTSEVEPDARRQARLRPGPRFCRDPRLERREPCIQLFDYVILEGASP